MSNEYFCKDLSLDRYLSEAESEGHRFTDPPHSPTPPPLEVQPSEDEPGEKSELNQVTMTPGQERVDKAPPSPPPLPLLPTPIRTLSSQTDPTSDILDDEFKKSDITVKLYQATLSDDWETVERILREDNTWISTRITKGGETVLHVAALAKHVNLVKELVNIMDDDCLSLKNRVGNTALCFAAVSGIVEIAKVMVEKSSTLPNIRGSQEMTPLLMVVLLGHQDMVWYLMSVTDYNLLSVEDGIELLTGAIETDLFEVALHILRNNKRLAIYRGRKKETALHILARKPPKLNRYQLSTWQRIKMTGCSINHVESQVMLELAQTIWDEIIKMKHQEISELICSPSRLLFMAARLGKVEFLMVLIKSYPDILWKVDENRYSIFHIAVIHRHKDIFKLIYEIGAIKDLIATYKDDNGNNMLHLASKLAPPNRLDCVSGAALQMQHELLWFEAVKKIVRPEYIEAENKDHKTPRTLFSEEHEVLRIKGEQWMKKTSESCALVATLIATVVFSAAFQLPGGSNDAGSPILVQKPSFVVFAMANAISLFTSTASILMFLSILTSRYAERDFLVSLPLKLMRGLILLLISITTMIVAFTATFFITFEKGVRWAPIPVALIASVPVILFAFQQFPLLIDIYYSTYNSQSIFHSCKQNLFTAPSQQKNFSSEHVDSTSTKIDIPFTILIPDASMDHHALYYACNSFSWRRMTSLIVDPEASDSPTFSSWRTR